MESLIQHINNRIIVDEIVKHLGRIADGFFFLSIAIVIAGILNYLGLRKIE